MKDTTLAYLAGMIDGDGYISIQKSTRKGVTYFGPSIGISGTRRQPHDLASSLWGGIVSIHKPKNSNHRDQFQWSRCGKSAIDVIEAIYPYLIVKKEQADIALNIWFILESGRGEDPFPWMGPDYNPTVVYNEYHKNMVEVNQSRSRLKSNKF